MPDPRVIREKYCATAGGYDELYGEEQRDKYSVIFTRHAPRGVILDIGAGTCLLAEYLFRQGLLRGIKYYIALDLTPCMLYFCKRRVKMLRLEHIVDMVEGEVMHLPLRGKSVDESYSVTVFDLVSSVAAAIGEQVRVTRHYAIYTLLKKVEHRRRVSMCERFVGETDKDVICMPAKLTRALDNH